MRKLLLFSIFLLVAHFICGQTIYEEIDSKKMGDTRRIKIQLPRNYEKNKDKRYPIVLVFDADYLFEPVAGNVDYLSYWEDIPEAIVVGIMQGANRHTDCAYDDQHFMPGGTGAKFFEFIGMELLPYVDKKYRTAKFIIAVGHDVSANFINYYLFKNPVLFNGYIVLSPDLAPTLDQRIAARLPEVKQKTFYYIATGSEDIPKLRDDAEALHARLAALTSDNFHYYFDSFPDASHYTLVSRGIPNALEKIFSVYRPITKKEFSEVLMTTKTPMYDFLTEKYAIIKNLFGLDDKIRINDFLAVGTAAEKRKEWDELEKIGKLAQKQYPEKLIGDYYLGRSYEENGNIKKAVHTYRNSFGKEEVDFITVDLLLDRADALK
ncbi:MAG TPA: alpha/beta hydrolase-fold protein [Flavobacteriaceae bacterium]|nr:alpha/beta hydrolase-fold protein [Flavobacteriaceae bacterium]